MEKVLRGAIALLAIASASPLVSQQIWMPRPSGDISWSPAGLLGAGAGYTTPQQGLVVFGGVDRFGTFSGTTWSWGGDAWRLVTVSAAPSPRAYHTMVSLWPLAGVLLHGGRYGSPSALSDETWLFDGNAWNRLSTAGPGARQNAAMANRYGTQMALLFGGADGANNTLGDTWVWFNETWTRHTPSSSPPARRGHAMSFDVRSGRYVLFGGLDASNQPLDDTWEYDGATWTQRQPLAAPPRLAYASLTLHPVTLKPLLHGGRNFSTGSSSSETWEWDSLANRWNLIPSATLTPPKRDLHFAAFDVRRNAVVVGGGFESQANLGELSTWELGITVSAAVFGMGGPCAGTLGMPHITPIGVPQLGNAAFRIDLGFVCPNSTAALLFSTYRDRQVLGGGCVLEIGNPFAVLSLATSAAGTASFPLGVPANPVLTGLELYTQAAVADPQGAFLGLASLTGGFRLVYGN